MNTSEEQRFEKNVEAFNNPKPGQYWHERFQTYFIIAYVVDDILVVLDISKYNGIISISNVVDVYSKIDFEEKIKYSSAFGKPLNKNTPTFVADICDKPIEETLFNSLISEIETRYPGGINNSIIKKLIEEKKYKMGDSTATYELHTKLKHLNNPQINDEWFLSEANHISNFLKIVAFHNNTHIIYTSETDFNKDKLKIIHRRDWRDLFTLPIENYSLKS